MRATWPRRQHAWKMHSEQVQQSSTNINMHSTLEQNRWNDERPCFASLSHSMVVCVPLPRLRVGGTRMVSSPQGRSRPERCWSCSEELQSFNPLPEGKRPSNPSSPKQFHVGAPRSVPHSLVPNRPVRPARGVQAVVPNRPHRRSWDL